MSIPILPIDSQFITSTINLGENVIGCPPIVKIFDDLLDLNHQHSERKVGNQSRIKKY
jgi:hypothetical protein